MPLHKDSLDLMAFITHNRLFCFCHVICGLVSAHVAFQKMSGVDNFLYDIITHGCNMSMHNKGLHVVLQQLEAAGFQLNKDKCSLQPVVLRSYFVSGSSVDSAGQKRLNNV